MEWLIPILICILVGVVLLVVEAFMPGFGVPGISGSVLLLGGIVMTWIEYGAQAGLGLTVIVLALLAIVISVSLRSAARGKLSKSNLVLNDNEDARKQDENNDILLLVGEVGETKTVLRPVGVAEFACGRLNVMTEGEYIAQGKKVRIKRVDGATVFVENV